MSLQVASVKIDKKNLTEELPFLQVDFNPINFHYEATWRLALALLKCIVMSNENRHCIASSNKNSNFLTRPNKELEVRSFGMAVRA